MRTHRLLDRPITTSDLYPTMGVIAESVLKRTLSKNGCRSVELKTGAKYDQKLKQND